MWRRLAAATLWPLVPLAAACSTVVTVPSPAEFVIAKAPSTVWVTKTDNSALRLQSPRVITDTLSGFVGGEYVEIPLSSVQSMRARQAAGRRTALLVGGLTVAGAAVVGFYLNHGSAASAPLCSPPDVAVAGERVC